MQVTCKRIYIEGKFQIEPRGGRIRGLRAPRLWSDTIRTIARQRARLDRQLAGRRKPIEPDDVDCGVPHLIEEPKP
jgi:hypothetical protein